MSKRISRRHFFFGTLLAGVIPRGGFGRPSLKALGYKSPNEKLNIAGIGAGGRAASDLGGSLESENIVALADVDWARGAEGFKRFDKAAKYKDFRQMLDKEGKNIDAVIIATPDHMHATAAHGVHAARQARLRREAADAHAVGSAPADARRRESTRSPRRWATRATRTRRTRVAAEIIWSGEIGDVTEVHAWTRPADLAAGHDRDSAAETGSRHRSIGISGSAARGHAALHAAGDEAVPQAYRTGEFGFYLPFNWRGFYDFGSSLIGDWGIHILGPANWALHGSGVPISVECIKQETAEPLHVPAGGVVPQVGVRRARRACRR